MNIKTCIAIPLLVLFLSVSLTISVPPAFAETPTVSVSSSCSVTDTDGDVHDYSGQFLGICALAAAYEQGAISLYALQNFSFGLFLASLNGISPSATEFWNIAHNGTDASVGLSDLVLAEGDTLTFQLKDFISNTDVGEPVSFAVSLKKSGGNSGLGGGQTVVTFDVTAALAFLSDKQKVDGSFGEDFITDWVAIALASLPGQGAGSSAAEDLVRAYLLTSSPAMANITDYERHAMALMALGIDPYIGVATDYITPIIESFDGVQIGDPSLVNDDIFALFPLPKAGYGADSDIILDTIAFILGKQGTNGAWEESVDLTAAAIQALAPFTSVSGVTNALTKAKGYLRDTRGLDGSWKNSFEMSWVVQALHASKESPSSWIEDGKSPMSALASTQESDGGVEPTTSTEPTRVWATAYAVPAALAKSWNDTLHSFSRPTATSIALGVSTTTATSTLVIDESATTTPEPVMGMETSSDMPKDTSQNPSLITLSTAKTDDGSSASEPFSEIDTLASETQDSFTGNQLAAVGGAPNELNVYVALSLFLVLAALFGAFLYPFIYGLFRYFLR